MKIRFSISNIIVQLIIIIAFNQFAIAQQQPEQSLSFAINDDDIHDFAITPDGSKAVVASQTALVVNLDTQEVLLEFNGHREYAPFETSSRAFIEVVDISPNGEFVATGDRNGTVIIWNIETGEILNTFRTPIYQDDPTSVVNKNISTVQFSPDGRMVAATQASRGRNKMGFQVWNINTGEIFFQSKYHGANEIIFAPKYDLIVNQAVHRVKIFSTSSGEKVYEAVSVAARMSSDDNTLFYVTEGDRYDEEQIVHLDLDNFELTYFSQSIKTDTINFDIGSNGKMALTQEDDATHLINFDNNTTLRSFAKNGTNAFQNVRFAPNGNKVVGVFENTLNFWDISDLTSGIPNALNMDN